MTKLENQAPKAAPRPTVLCILDGWGDRAETTNNAIALTPTPNWDRLRAEGVQSQVLTFGDAVGLPDGQMGNSEVGHMNLGAGRIATPELPRIDKAVLDGSLAQLPELKDFIAALKRTGGTAHVMGLLSPGGVHSHQDHLAGLAKVFAGQGIPVAIHAFLDGRDTAPKSAAGFMAEFEAAIKGLPGVTIATIGGRYFAMDRDKNWARIAKAYDVMVKAEGPQAASPAAAIATAYEAGETDEFVTPHLIAGYRGMADGDGCLMANFRADRARQILTALLDPAFDGFDRGAPIRFASALGMVEYGSALNRLMPALFRPETYVNGLGEYVAALGLRQLRIAETEKYAHVTFFFSGGREEPYPGEDRILVPSPKVATYDLKPEMSAPEVTDRLVEVITAKRYDLIVVNFANPDMVGHTGILAAAQKAVATIDESLGRIAAAVAASGAALIVTADHGNVEMMVDPETGEPHTQHTVGAVPILLWGEGFSPATHGLEAGRLADVAPTVLAVMGLPKPLEMTGRSLLGPPASGRRAVA